MKMISIGFIVLLLLSVLDRICAQHGYISLNARALSDTKVLVSRHDVGGVHLANLDFSYRRDGESSWVTQRFNPTREYFPHEDLNSSTLYYFRLQGRQLRSYHIVHSYTHIRTPPYTQQPPSNVTAVTQSDGSVLVSWLPEPDGRILGYLVIYTEVDSRARSLTEYKVKPVFRFHQTVLRDLKGSRYKVEVASMSLDGEGASKRSILIGKQNNSFVRISIPPRDLRVQDEGIAILTCRAEGFPEPKIIWRKSGRKFNDKKHRFLEETVDGLSVLRIDPVASRQDKGTYTCIATNGQGQIKRSRAVLDTYKPRVKPKGYPVITKHPSLLYAEEGSKAVMNCTSTGDEKIVTTWYKDSFPVYYAKNERLIIGPNDELIINGARPSDEGSYECSAENRHGIAFSYPAHLYVTIGDNYQRSAGAPSHMMAPQPLIQQKAPEIPKSRRRFSVLLGGNVSIPCDANGAPMPTMWWEHKNKRLESSSYNGHSMLVLTNVTQAGRYTCIAENRAGTAKRDFNVKVILPEPIPSAPTFTKPAVHLNVTYRSNVELECQAKGYPAPDVIWTDMEGVILKKKHRHGLNVLRRTRMRRSKNFTCIASNTEGLVSLVYTVIVGPRDPPTITSMDARAVDSATIRVSWSLKQHPQARVYQGVDVEYREMSDTGEVVGQRIQRYFGTGNTMLLGSLNSGTTYEVQVLARTGTEEEYVPSRTVTVSTDPEFPEPPFNLRTPSISHSEIEISWDTRTPLERLSGFSVFVLDVESGLETLHRIETAVSNSFTIPNLQENSEYEISVSSWIRGDQGNRSEPLAVRTDHFAPDAPPYVKGNSINASSLEVTWGLPEDRYARSYIIGHHVKYEDIVPSHFSTSKTVSVRDGTKVMLTSLQENNTYKIQVRAFTAHNQGQWSQPIRLKTMVSPQPEDLTPTLVSHNSIHLTWDAPIILRDIKSFNVYVRDTSRGRQTKAKVPAEKEFTITGLLPDTRYTIRVSSNYNSRESDLSEPLDVLTLPYIPPSPSDVKVESVNETVVEVEWSPVRDSLITGYHITYQELDRLGRAVEEVWVDASERRVLIPGLTHDTTYKIKVRAETSTEKGQYSVPEVVTTLESDKPVAVQVSSVTYNQAELTWYAPVEKRGITGFRLVLTDEAEGAVRRENIPGDLQYLLTNLHPDTKYTVTIRSKMGAMRGKVSDEFHFKTKPFVPKAPINIQSAPVNDTAVRISWTPTLTDDTKGYVVRYHVTYHVVGEAKEQAVQVAGEANVAAIASLSADTAYRIKVRAETLTEQGDYSLPTRVRTLKSDKPEKLKITNVDYNYVDFSWSAPVDQREITGFELFMYDVSTGEITRKNIPPTTRHTVRPLEPDRRYALTLKSLIDGIEGKTSDVLEFKTLPYIPDAPVELNASPINDTAAIITWTPTTTDENRRYVVRYHVEYRERVSREEGDVSSGSVQVPGDIHSAVIVSLQADTKYRVRVRAETQTEEGKYSQPAAVQTLKSDKPIRLKTSRIKFNEAVLSWYAPVRERNITMFNLALTDVRSGNITRRSLPSNLRHVLRALEPDRRYTVTLTSVIPGIQGKTSDLHEFKTLPFVPKPPRNVRTSALNDTSVQVIWTPTVTDETRRYVTRYNIVYSKQGSYGSSQMNIQVPGNEVMGVITSLEADTSYSIKVRAETLTEQGEYTQPAVARTMVSDRPGSLQTTDINFNEVKVMWYAPVKDRNITGFQLLLNDVATGETTPEQLPPVLEHTLTGLEPDRKYTLQVTPQLKRGIGKSSNVLEFQTAPYIPEAPTSVTATALHDTAVEIHWTPSVDDSNRRFIQQYKITYLKERGGHFTELSLKVGKEATSVIIDSLAADTKYNIRVRAETKTEVGKYNTPVLVRTLLSDKPMSLRTTGLQFNQANMSWYAPISERNITGFDLVLSDVTTGEVSRKTTPPTPRHSFTRLKPDRDYTLTVKSNLKELKGKTSDVLEFRTLPYIPDAPADVVVTALHDTGLSVGWRPTVDEETSQYVVRYRVSYSVTNTDSTDSIVVGKNDTSVDILSLAADTSYTVRVRAETDTEDGTYSPPTSATTLLSDKPISLRIKTLQFNQADVSWIAPVKQRNIVGFELSLGDATTRDIKQERVPPDTSYIFTALKPDRDYTLAVKSVLEDFEGKTSDIFEFRTLPYIPDAPADVIVTPLHDTALLVTWTPTVNQETYEYINRYVISYNILNEVETTSPWVDKDSATFQIDKLSADTSYRVRVRAETPTEKGQYSEPVISRTLLSDKPMSLKINYLQFNQADVSWVAPVKQRNIVGFELSLGDATTRDIKQERVPPDTSYSFTALKPDRDYTLTVKSILENFEGKTSDVFKFRTLPYIPDAPADVIVTPLHDTALLVTWTPTVNQETYEYINRYVISYNILNEVETTSPWVDKDSATFQIDKLSADTSYRVRVRAETPTEKGQYSEPVISKTLVSDRPQSLRTTGVQFNEVEIAWYAPINARNITSFRIELTDESTGEVTVRSTQPVSRYGVTGLEPDRKYSLTLTSVFGDGAGKTSQPLNFKTLPYIPKPPDNVIANAVSDTTVEVEWTPTVDDDTRRFITLYNIAYKRQGSRDEMYVNAPPDISRAVINNLQADTGYEVKVKAITATQEGLFTQPVFFKSLQSDKPRSLKTFGLKFNQTDMSWYAPVLQRSITGFLLMAEDQETGEVIQLTIPPKTRYTLTGLTAEHTYVLTITSLMGDTEGKTSDALQFKTLPFVPRAPENVILTPINDTSILVEWTPPVTADTARYVVGYDIAYNLGGRSERVRDRLSVQAPGDSNMAVINHLDANTEYRVRMRAETKTQTGALSKATVVKTLESDMPRGLKALNVEFDRAELSWYAPVKQRNITNFVVTITDTLTGEITQQVLPPKTRQTVSGLKAERKYELTVTSMLGEQEGKTSDVLELTTKPFVPETVEGVMTTALNQSTILVQWQNPDDIASREYITSFRLEYGEIDRFRRVRNPITQEHRGWVGQGYITGLTEDTDYRIRVRAETDTQSGPYTRAYLTTTLMSEQPRQLRATSVDYSSIALAWVAPIEQRNITSFNVFSFDTTIGEETRFEIPPKLTFRLASLIPDRVYAIMVSAMIGVVEGQMSKPIEVKTDPFIPRAPTNVTSYPINATAVHVEWVAPDDFYAREYVIGFNVLYDKARSKLPVEKWGLLEYYGHKQNSLIKNLEPDTEYNILVRVNTKTEKGGLSEQINVKTMVSAEPMNLQAPRVSFDQFDVTWEAPVEERNISAFAVYLTESSTNGKTREEIGPVQTHSIDSLSPSSLYVLEVASILDSGEGILSAPLTVETTPFVPEPPTGVQATSYNFSSVTFRWKLPKDPASKTYIKGCHLLYTKNIEGHVTEQEVLPGPMEATIVSTLEEDSTYRVQVRAFSDTAEGKLSRPIIISTPPKIPDWSPDLLTATVEYDRSVRVEWYVNSPKASLDRTLKYEIQYFRQPDPYGDMYVRDLDSGPTIIDNLETHSTYSFRIRAYSYSGPGPWSSALETTLDGPDLGKIDILRINRTDPYSSKVRWVHIGSRSLTIEGFRVYYTPVDYKFEPMPGQRYINSVGPRLRFDQMRSLLPEQYYHVQVAAFSEDGIGKRSDVRFLPDMDYPRIAAGPRDKKVAAKLAVTFTCQISGVPDYKVYWKKGNVRLPRRHERFEYRMVNSSSVLRLKQAMPKDSAVYNCVLDVNGTLYTKGGSLEVYDQTEIPSGYPAFTRNPSLTSVETGSNTSFICAATGIPVPSIKWYKNNVPITESRKFVVTQIGRESRLWILNATLEDVGKYVCSAENRHGTISNFDAQLYVKLKRAPPNFVETPEDMYVLPGSEVNLTCVVEGEPPPTVRWLKDGAYVTTAQSDTYRDDLIIPEVYVSGEYTCEATNNQGQKSVSSRVQIDRTSEFKGVVLREPRDKTVVYGSSVTLECEGAGNPKPNIFWEKDGKRLSREDFGKSYYLEEKAGVSMLGIGKVVGTRDQGVFACTVENSLGYSEAVAALTVLKKKSIPAGFPVITKRNVVTAVARGASTSLYCAANDPEAVVTWYKDRFSITSTKSMTITTTDGASKLRIVKARDKHYGKYHCSAENKFGIAYSKPAMLYIRRTTRKKS